MIDISGENVVLVGALLLFVAVMAGKVAYRFGAPALLLFLGVGMLFGLNFISYRSVEMTQFVGMIALCIILFTGLQRRYKRLIMKKIWIGIKFARRCTPCPGALW